MSLLKAEPPGAVRSLDELFALALALETEAAGRYAALAEEMEALDLPEVAGTFRHLAVEERGHAEHVDAWARVTTGTPPDSDRIRWQPPETFDEEEARQIASSRLATAYRALSMAVRNEERAFALWTYIAAQAETPAIRAAAERMAGEELHHAALLRRARRRAYHAERQASAAPAGQASPLARAALAEGHLARLLPALASGDGVGGADAAMLRQMGAAAEDMAREAAALAGTAPASAAPAGRPQTGEDARRLAEQAAEAYLDAAETAREEDRVTRLQALARAAIARVAMLRSTTGPA